MAVTYTVTARNGSENVYEAAITIEDPSTVSGTVMKGINTVGSTVVTINTTPVRMVASDGSGSYTFVMGNYPHRNFQIRLTRIYLLFKFQLNPYSNGRANGKKQKKMIDQRET